MQATQAVKIKFEIDKKSISKINFVNNRFQKSSAGGQRVSVCTENMKHELEIPPLTVLLSKPLNELPLKQKREIRKKWAPIH